MDVKRIFFEEGSQRPSFELGDGTIRHPAYDSSFFNYFVGYYTSEELDIVNKRRMKEVEAQASVPKPKWWKIW